jgi:biopolymer transport protein ExbD
VFLNRQPVGLDALAGRLRSSAGARQDLQVRINADRAVDHGTVMRVLDAVRQAGLHQVSFQTTREAR